MGRWVWAFTKPGISTFPAPSITRSNAPWGRWVPTEAILVPSTAT